MRGFNLELHQVVRFNPNANDRSMPDMSGESAAAVPGIRVIGIGASAGGVEALKTLFGNMPSDTGMAFLVVMHLAPDRDSLLAEILGHSTHMPVVQATDGVDVLADHVYVIMPGTVLSFADGRLGVVGAAVPHRQPNPVDLLFSSLAVALGDKAVGIVLSGTGSDGALGLKAIRDSGGIAMAQGRDGSASYFDGMPNAATAVGAVDMFLPVAVMPERLLSLVACPPTSVDDLPPPGSETALDGYRASICGVLRNQIGHDFSGYKPATLFRRVQRRMQLFHLDIEDYIQFLATDPQEVALLFHELLIGVTKFFRDAATFDVLARQVMPLLFEGRGADSTVRVWVSGCATGEEAYSLAILLIEHMETLPVAPRVQVFATDIDDAAVSLARAGRYPAALVRDVAPERLERFFTLVDGQYVIAKQVRELCTFSTHSVIRDPPFSRLNLISCRNLLIYLDSELQAQVIPAFHYALSPGGVLWLGSSETVTRHEDLFAPLDKTHRVFQRREVATPLPLHSGPRRPAGRQPAVPPLPSSPRPGPSTPSWSRRARDRVLDGFAPPFVVVNGEGQVLQFSARTRQYLEQGAGTPTRDVLAMARHGLRPELRAALRQARETGRRVDRHPVSLAGDEAGRTVTLTVEPLGNEGERLFLVVFTEAAPAQGVASAEPAEHGPPDSNVEVLEAELRDAHQRMQTAMEESDAALEELTSANEELHSVNEELQSANEELETSREEMQSMNEELHTVNGQLAGKVDELDRANSDVRNLFESTQVATIFLDRNLIVRSFTPAVAGIYNLIPSDRGRPLTDILCHVDGMNLKDDVPRVLETLTPLEKRVVQHDGSVHYLKRVRPYRTSDDTVDGVLITFLDITSVVEIEKQQLLVDELNHRVRNVLAVVLAMCSQTLRRAKTLEEFEAVFVGRIDALAAAYTLVARENWSEVSLREILDLELRPHVRSSNTTMEGPNVSLPPRVALVLGIAVHELATNAVRHGALSVPSGEVSVSWHIETGAPSRSVVLEWHESGGPAVTPPSRRGFGLSLLERSVSLELGGTASVTFNPDGVQARFSVPLGAASTVGGRMAASAWEATGR
jgi:two-component system CheB/CheR fusion protein